MIKYSDLQFERDPASVTGFASRNRASTDAINALEKWKARAVGRDYDVLPKTETSLSAYG